MSGRSVPQCASRHIGTMATERLASAIAVPIARDPASGGRLVIPSGALRGPSGHRLRQYGAYKRSVDRLVAITLVFPPPSQLVLGNAVVASLRPPLVS